MAIEEGEGGIAAMPLVVRFDHARIGIGSRPVIERGVSLLPEIPNGEVARSHGAIAVDLREIGHLARPNWKLYRTVYKFHGTSGMIAGKMTLKVAHFRAFFSRLRQLFIPFGSMNVCGLFATNV